MSEDKEKGISINFGLKSFKVKEYKFNLPKKEIDLEKIDYNIQFRTDADIEKETLSIEFKITGQIGKKETLKLGSIQTLTIYKLSTIEPLIKDDGNIGVPEGLAVSLLSISLSTTRGALAAKSENNVLSDAPLPLVDPKELYNSSPLNKEIKAK